jgi:hypothetical protein
MTTKKNRPHTVTITLLGVILLGAWSAAQALAMGRQVSLFLALDISPDPRLLLIISVSWAVLFWGSAIALLRRCSFSRWLVPLLILVYALYELLLQGLFVASPISGQSWLLRIVLYDVAILFALWSLNRSAARLYFVATQPVSVVEQRE